MIVASSSLALSSILGEKMTFSDFKKIIIEDVDKTILKAKKTNKSTGAFSELLNFPNVSKQSISIKMGNILENSYNKFIDENEIAKSIKNVEKDNINHQIDIMFLYNNNLYYFESKINLNLDTEKSKATIYKIKKIEEYLTKKYSKYNIICKLLSSRYDTSSNVKHTKKQYIDYCDVYGYSDFFKIFGVEVTKEQWENFFNEVGELIVKTLM